MSWKDVHVHRPKQRTSNTQKNYCSNYLRCLAVQQHLLLYFGLVLPHFSNRLLLPWKWQVALQGSMRLASWGKVKPTKYFLVRPLPTLGRERIFCFVSSLESLPGHPTCSCSSHPLKPEPIQQLHKSLWTGLQRGVEQLAAHGGVTPFSLTHLHLPLK